MPHMVESMAYAGEVPWHGLGRRVSNDLTPIEMMKAAGANWEVHEIESYVDFCGKHIPTGQKSLVRGDTKKVLTNVGKDWHTVQNRQAFEFFDEYVRRGDMDMHTAGSLKDGQIVWALAQIKDSSFDLFGGDKIDSYLLFSNPHQYGMSVDIRFTPIRVVCNNTLTWALEAKAERSVKVSHVYRFDDKIEHVKKTLGIAQRGFTECREMAKFLGSKRYDTDSLHKYYREIFPGRNADKRLEATTGNAKRCLELVESQPGAEYAEGSWWQAFNSVTYLTDHIQGKTADNRLYSQWYGKNQQFKIRAAREAVKYAKAA